MTPNGPKSDRHGLYFLKSEYGAKEKCRSLTELQYAEVIMEFLPSDTKNNCPVAASNYYFNVSNSVFLFAKLHHIGEIKFQKDLTCVLQPGDSQNWNVLASDLFCKWIYLENEWNTSTQV